MRGGNVASVRCKSTAAACCFKFSIVDNNWCSLCPTSQRWSSWDLVSHLHLIYIRPIRARRSTLNLLMTPARVYNLVLEDCSGACSRHSESPAHSLHSGLAATRLSQSNKKSLHAYIHLFISSFWPMSSWYM